MSRRLSVLFSWATIGYRRCSNIRAHDVAQLLQIVVVDEVGVVAIAPCHVLVDAVNIRGERIDDLLRKCPVVNGRHRAV